MSSPNKFDFKVGRHLMMHGCTIIRRHDEAQFHMFGRTVRINEGSGFRVATRLELNHCWHKHTFRLP